MAVDMFLKLDGIKGESMDDRHRSEIEIESFSWGATQTGSSSHGGGGGAGKVTFSDLSFTKKSDTASPLLALSCANGKHIKSGVLTLAKSGQKAVDYFVIKMTDILITSYQVGGSEPDSPRETCALNYANISYTVKGQRPDGSVDQGTTMEWDAKANEAGSPNL
jgi:type VI secretion system secreted protein Hcp